MTRPGDRLRRLAARVCSADTMAHVIDPLIADLQREHHDARSGGRRWRSRWIHTSACTVFWKVMVIQAGAESLVAVREYARADDRAMARVAAFFCIALAAALAVHIVSWWPAFDRFDGSDRVTAIVYFVPAGLAIGLQLALCIGIAAALRRREISSRVRRRIVAVGVVATLFAFGNAGWVMPASNQAFRELAAGRRIPKGANELTLSELRASSFTFAYHLRLAISIAPLVHTWFAVALVARRRTRWPVATTIGVSSVYVAYYTVLAFSPPPAPLAVAAAWAPNLLLCAISFSPRTPSTAG